MCVEAVIAFHLDTNITDDRIEEEMMEPLYLFENTSECAFICPDGFICIPLVKGIF